MSEAKVGCKEVMEHICDSLGEELDSPRCLAIKDHLKVCTNCQNYFKSVEKTIEFYRVYNPELPKETHQNLMKKLGLD